MAHFIGRTGGLLCLLLVLAQQASAQDYSSLASRLDRLERENRALKARIDHLEHRTAPTLPKTHSTSARHMKPVALVSRTAPPVVVLEKHNSFDGAYIGVFGGDEFRNNSRVPIPQSLALGGFTDFHETSSTSGLIGGFAGYNRTLGLLLVGLEVRGQYNFFSRSYDAPTATSNNPLPQPLLSCSGCNPSTQPLSQVADPYTLRSSQNVTAQTGQTFGGDLSARFGMILHDDWLLYSRIGAGAQMFTGSITTSTDRTLCNSPVVTRTIRGPFDLSDSLTGCGSITSSHEVVTNEESSVSGYLVAGFGIERNVGKFFGRFEADVRDYLGAYSGQVFWYQPFYTTTVAGAVGYRF